MGKLVDLTGKRFGKLLVVGFAKKYLPPGGGSPQIRWACLCDCGEVTNPVTRNLNNGHTSSCGVCTRGHSTDRLPEGEAAFRRKLAYYKNLCAKKRGLVWSLTDAQAKNLMRGPCAYCGAEPDPYNGVDRIAPNEGYVPENVVSCCWTCNRAKNNMSLAEFRAWIQRAFAHMNKEIRK